MGVQRRKGGPRRLPRLCPVGESEQRKAGGQTTENELGALGGGYFNTCQGWCLPVILWAVPPPTSQPCPASRLGTGRRRAG